MSILGFCDDTLTKYHASLLAMRQRELTKSESTVQDSDVHAKLLDLLKKKALKKGDMSMPTVPPMPKPPTVPGAAEQKTLNKSAPPSFDEETMKKLKKEHGEEGAFKIAWAAHNKKHGVKKSEDLTKDLNITPGNHPMSAHIQKLASTMKLPEDKQKELGDHISAMNFDHQMNQGKESHVHMGHALELLSNHSAGQNVAKAMEAGVAAGAVGNQVQGPALASDVLAKSPKRNLAKIKNIKR
jgi:hypothetical protein